MAAGKAKMVVGFDIDKVQLKIAGVEAANRGLKCPFRLCIRSR